MKTWTPKFEHHINADSIESMGYDDLKQALDESLSQFKFKSVDSRFDNRNIKQITFWKKKNININRSIVLIELSSRIRLNDLVNLIHKIKFSLGKETGYVPFFHVVGIQVVVIGDEIISELTRNPIDIYNNFRAIVQSFFVIDRASKQYYKSITWGQTVSVKFQEDIDTTIRKQINILKQ